MRAWYILATWAASFVFSMANSQSLPYNPTSIFLTPTNPDIAYVFLSSSEPDTTAPQLLSLNISSTLSFSTLALEIITSELPFQTNGSTAFIPSIATSGEISVYTGSCSTSEVAQLWTFTGASASTGTLGHWVADTTVTASDVTSEILPGANPLSKAFSFSNYADGNVSDSSIYVFGGMCPNSSASTSTWQSSALYSNHMLRLTPASSTYTLDYASSRGPPVAEAGFSITGLTPTYLNNSKPVTQQQNYVLIGGHTQTAFINMSQVAIWSLPEETWSFFAVDPPSISSPNPELAVKSAVTSVDSRSGHTAVLSEDGSKIVLVGGWVGDVTQAADPQLAILELGAGFGGGGNWQWSVPSQQPTGAGIYGHGAAMLPGNIMMILGGYNISSSTRSKRATSTSTPALFYNVTSSSWVSDYTNPSYTAAMASRTASNSAIAKSKAKNHKIALGVGIGLGLSAVLIALLIFCGYKRHLRGKREAEREKYIQSFSAGNSHHYLPPTEMGEDRRGSFPWSQNRWNRTRGQHDPDLADEVTEYEDLNPDNHAYEGDIPSPPKQIQRKPLHSRNARGRYQPAPAFDFNVAANHGRANSLGTAGPIHPIYEADEEDRVSNVSKGGIGVAMGDPPSASLNRTRSSNRGLDPFGEHNVIMTGSSHPDDSESPTQSREREIQEWVSDWAAADAMIQARSHSSAGRVSPSRRAHMIAVSNVNSVSAEEDSARTASNLSDRSVAISAMTVSRSGSSGTSSRNSLRGFITNAISPFAGTVLSTTVASTSHSPLFDINEGVPASDSSNSSHSFTTAHTSFGALQAEAEGLLPRPYDERRGGNESPTYGGPAPGSPSKSKPLMRGGWLGGIRRAIAGDSANTTSPTNSHGTRTPSPIRNEENTQPRRTVSAGATLWRRKQGKSDWQDSEYLNAGQRSSTFTSDMPFVPFVQENANDDDWDVERAIQNRVVQVMFTVPKERLRVVNHDFSDEEASEVGSLRSKKGSGKSVKQFHAMSAVVEEKGKGKEIVADPPYVGSGKGKVVDSDTREPDGRAKSRVLNIVEKIEGRSTPE